VYIVPSDRDGAALGSCVRDATHLAWTAVKKLVHGGKVRVDGAVVTDAGARVRAGSTIVVAPSAPRVTQQALPKSAIVHLDAHLVVVEKPSGISTVPYEPDERGTLVDRVRVALHRSGRAASNAPLFVVHRIDKETSGLVVFARTWLAKRHLASLFREHTIERTYLALVEGHIARDRFTVDTHLVENRGDGLRGSAKQSGLGVRAITHVEVLERLDGPASLVRCRLETGRTHQIRVHLAEIGHPLVGERVYSRHYELPRVEAPRLMLHAATLGFTHPAHTERTMRFHSTPPDDFRELAARLGATVSVIERH
jgi:23S rRNA pseudouridine1911/1915/1917 synthase